MISEVFHFLLSFAEVIAVIVSILIAGLTIAVAVFWILSWSLGQPSDEPGESDSGNGDMDDHITVTTPPDAASPPESDRVES
jgi:hypothetical protein